MKHQEAVVTLLAKNMLGVETLTTRNNDDLDLHNLSVWQIKAALENAYQAGKAAKK